VDRNFLLFLVLSMLVLVMWSSLQPARPPKPVAPAGTEAPAQAPAAEGPAGLPKPAAEPPPEAVAKAPQAPAPAPVEEREEQFFQFEQPLYSAELSDRGAVLRHWELRTFHTGGPHPEPIVLTTGQAPEAGAGSTALEGLGLGDLSRASWDVETRDARGATFVIRRGGLVVRKIWRFDDGYRFELKLDVENHSARAVKTDFAVGWPAHVAPGNDFRGQALVALHAGGLQQQLLHGLGVGGVIGRMLGREPQTQFGFSGDNDWAGMHTTYFLAILLPEDPSRANVSFSTLEPGVAGITRISFEETEIPPGKTLPREFRGFAGPKVPELLEALGSHTMKSVDIGWAWVAPLSHFFAWMLHQIYRVIPNYGVAIILLTILVRVVTTPLTLRQMRSMERMRAVQPQLKAIQEKYADDRQKQSEEMMRLYRQEKVNPLGGCIPMFFQMPVFIGLYYALRSSIQLRQAPFVGWIHDLSAPELLFVIPGLDLPLRGLPLVMGVTMVLQQRITPMQADPNQARMMQTIMPIMMTVLFYQFASGLVLYWMVSNVLAIGHQLWVGRRMRAGAARA
jgi:YidC/Oxa1 family membrane protein insertase